MKDILVRIKQLENPTRRIRSFFTRAEIEASEKEAKEIIALFDEYEEITRSPKKPHARSP